jgi:hypothetical protein
MAKHEAEELILTCARASGLTEEVANALWFAEKHGLDVVCTLLESLAEDFEESITSPTIIIEDLCGGGLDITPRSEAEKDEVAAYMG